MDADALARTEEDLVRWGLLERADGLRWTRRFRGAVMRAAMRLAEEERVGRAPAGHPVEVSVRAALAELHEPDLEVGPLHARFLAAVELAALPEPVRAMLDAAPSQQG